MPNSFAATERRLCVGFFVLCLALNLGFSTVGFRNSLLEVHDFRQVQTALTARCLQEDGWNFTSPLPLFGPPWSAPMEFPFYQVCVAKFSSLTGLALEPAGRVVALAFLYLALPACFGLAGALGFAGPRRWLLPALVLVSPAYLYYSRTFMIESTALCASVWFLFGYVRTLAQPSPRWLAVAVLAGIAAALVKVTTLIVFLVPAAAYTIWLLSCRWHSTAGPRAALALAARALAATVPAVLAGTWWVHYSDAVKASNPLAAWLVSSNLTRFNFGTLAQRLTGAFWERILAHTTEAIAPVFNLALVALFAVLLGRGVRARASLLLLGFLAGPLVFANLYFVHDYYFYASGLFLVGALALAWNQVLDLTAFSLAARWSVIAVSTFAQLAVFLTGYFHAQRHELNQPPELAAILAAATQPDDVILVFGNDWASHLTYYSHRRTLMVRDNELRDLPGINAVIERTDPAHLTALVASGQLRKDTRRLEPFIQRLHLRADPFMVNDDTVIFLAESRIPDALERLEASPPKTFSFAAPTADTGSTIPRTRTLAITVTDPALLSMMSPRPAELIHPFPLGTYLLNDRPTFNAHAPTDVVFRLKPGATTLTADFGILDAASEGKNFTEGVEFRIELVSPEGDRRTLHSVYLDPCHRPADRGLKSMSLNLPVDAHGRLLLRTLPGPTGSISCGWAYWARINLR